MNISLNCFGIIMYISFQQMLQWSTKRSSIFANSHKNVLILSTLNNYHQVYTISTPMSMLFDFFSHLLNSIYFYFACNYWKLLLKG